MNARFFEIEISGCLLETVENISVFDVIMDSDQIEP
jgi:hypothetical protein